ncbi:MAG: exosortase A [Thauera sp.]|jgi:exosortase A|nr:exosortase A [Thauera sp.]
MNSPSSAFPRISLALLLALGWVLLWYWPTGVEMAGIWWRSDTYAHGLVVLPISAWLVWSARARLANCQLKPEWSMCLPILAGGILWTLGGLASVAAAQHFALAVMLVALCVGILGWRAVRILLFPLLFLFFAVPIGDFMVPTLMHYTAEFTVWALRLSGVPVYQEGLHLVVPNGRWSVVEACSGSRYLTASLMIGALYAYLTYRSLRRRLWFMLAAAVVPIIANWLRAYMIVMLGYLTDNKLGVGADHVFYGWVLFGVVIFLLFAIGGRWQEPDLPVPAAAGAPDQAHRKLSLITVFVLGISLLPFPFVLRALDAPVESFPVALELPAPADGWVPSEDETLSYRPRYDGARATAYQAYRVDHQPEVGLYLAWYYGQREGSEMLNWSNGVITVNREEGHGLLQQQKVQSGSGLAVHEWRITTPQGPLLVWQFYRSDGRNLYRESEMKIRLALERLLGREDESAVVVLVTPAGRELTAARERLESFMSAHLHAIEQTVDAASRSIPQ